jgi:hypothetical protein
MKQRIDYLPCGHEGYLIEPNFLVATSFYYCNDCGKVFAVELREVQENDDIFKFTTGGVFRKIKELGRMSQIRCNIGIKQAKELGLFEDLK